MTSPDLSGILADLAAGRISAAEAAERIDALKAHDTPTAQPTIPDREDARDTDGWQGPAGPTWTNYGVTDDVDDSPSDEVPPSERRRPRVGSAVDRVSVRAVGRRVRIVGDYSVTTVAAEGPHILRRTGSVMEVSSDGEIGPSLDGFSMLRPPRNLDDIRAMSLGKELYLRVNPNLVVDVETTAGSLSTEKVPYLGKVRVTAGSAKLQGIAEIDDALIQAGQCAVSGSVRTGRNRIRCESGSLSVHLDADSQVSVHGEAQLGKVSWPGGEPMEELVLGNGSARLDIDVVMGYASIKVEGES